MSCTFCGSETKRNQELCKDCISYLPPILKINTKNTSIETLCLIIDKIKRYDDVFCATAYYGDLAIDDVNLLFAVSKKYRNDKPVEKNIFSIYDLENIDFHCKSPRASHETVYADVEFSFKTLLSNNTCNVIIKKNAKCQSKRTDSSHLSWALPAELSMFQEMFMQLVKKASERLNKILSGYTVYDLKVEKARDMFMLNKDYTLEELNWSKSTLLKVFEADPFNIGAVEKIIDNYRLLVYELQAQKTTKKKGNCDS